MTDRIILYAIPDCGMIWAGLQLSGSKPLYFASFYKPPNHGIIYLGLHPILRSVIVPLQIVPQVVCHFF